MKVKDLMSKKLFTVGPEEMLDKVFFLFNFESIRHLPVVEKGKVVGVISDRDLKKILGPRKKFVTDKVDGTQFTVPSRRVRTITRLCQAGSRSRQDVQKPGSIGNVYADFCQRYRGTGPQTLSGG